MGRTSGFYGITGMKNIDQKYLARMFVSARICGLIARMLSLY